MTTQEFTTVEALRLQCAKIRQFATEALGAAIQRRDAVLVEVRHEEQRLAAIAAERRIAEESLSIVHDEVERLMRELEVLGTELTSSQFAAVQTTPSWILPTAPTATVYASATHAPAPTATVADDSMSTVHDEMAQLTRELELLSAQLTPPAARVAAPVLAASEWSRPAADVPLPLA